MTIAQLFEKMFEYGPLAVITLYLIWKQERNYKGVCDRLNHVEDYCKDTLSALVIKSLEVIDRNTDALRHCKKKLEEKKNEE